MPDSQRSAFLALELGAYSLRLRLHSNGHPETLRTAFRRALAPSRTIIRRFPGEFISAVHFQIARLCGSTAVKIAASDDLDGDGAHYLYKLTYGARSRPQISIEDKKGLDGERLLPFFPWVGERFAPHRAKPTKEFKGPRRSGPQTRMRRHGLLVSSADADKIMRGETVAPKPNTNNDQTNSYIKINDRVQFDTNTSPVFNRMRVNFKDVTPTSLTPDPDYDAEHTRAEDASPI